MSSIKKHLLLGLLCFYCVCSLAQVRINEYGMMQITAQTPDYGSALRCVVPTSSSYAYNLWYANADRFFVNATGYLWCYQGNFFGSDSSMKENITDIDNPLNKILELKGVRYKYKAISPDDFDSQNYRYGFIAQDVERILPEVVKDMPNGTKAITYTDIIAVLVEAFKEQQKEMRDIQVTMDQTKRLLQNEIDSLKSRLSESTSEEALPKESFQLDKEPNGVVLYQNAPNPFNMNTTITCDIPESIFSAELCVYDMSGTKVKCYKVSQRGHVNIQITAGELSNGVYTYLLIADGQVSQSKQMILTK